MSHGEILGESELWQKLNRALMTCSQGQHWLTNGARLFILLTFRAVKDRRIAHLTCECSVILSRMLLVCSMCENPQEIMEVPWHAFKEKQSTMVLCQTKWSEHVRKDWLKSKTDFNFSFFFFLKWLTDPAPVMPCVSCCVWKSVHAFLLSFLFTCSCESPVSRCLPPPLTVF